ncbi:MAG: hypothetical protein U5L01_08305 [Rheinheimera sp.]|nr:hypothetical protein [Rheinheimera sp.]
MLINTVVLFLRELMPVMLLLSVLSVWQREHWRALLMCIAVPALIVLLMMAKQYSKISLWADGAGLELVYAILYFSVPLLLALALILSKFRICLVGFAGAALLAINGSNLVLYFFVYQREASATPALLLGSALGVGIGLSVAVLLYYSLDELKRFRRQYFYWVVALIAARQSSEATQILIQSDWIPGGPVLWDSQKIINEQSEYGQFFNALVGYEATPTLSQLIAYFLTAAVILALSYRKGAIR